MKHEYPDHFTMVLNLLEHYEASGEDGATWYRESRAFARWMQREYGTSLGKNAGIIAALSPQVQWGRNKAMACEVAETGWTTGQTTSNIHKAVRIWEGERPLSVLGGQKVRAFYRAIMGDHEAVVLDTWMANALGWPHNSFSQRQYERCEAALREAASRASVPPANFQAVVWTQVRGGGE